MIANKIRSPTTVKTKMMIQIFDVSIIFADRIPSFFLFSMKYSERIKKYWQ